MNRERTSVAPCLALIALLMILGACAERTYVLVTVEVDPSITEPITELRFDSLVTNGVEVFNQDSQRFAAGGKPIKLPQSFVVLANGWGKNGETVGMAVEAYNADGTVVARARGQAIILEGRESSEQVLLQAPCSIATECLDGQAFCDNPHVCNCEGPDCLTGFCDPVVKDDGNQCTEFTCDATSQTASNAPTGEGNACGTAASGAPLYCGQGICKEPECGDFIVDAITGEECDEGQANSDSEPGACRVDCRKPSCGDGVIDNVPAFGVVYNEECDEGAANVVVEDGVENETTFGSACRQRVTLEDGTGAELGCALPRCGDGVIDANERCDDHDSVNGDGCNPTCSLLGSVQIIAGAHGGPGDTDGVGVDARLRLLEPAGTAVIGDTLFFTSSDVQSPPSVIRAIAFPEAQVDTVAGTLGVEGHADGARFDSLFKDPRGLSVVGTEVFIADRENHRIKVFDTSTGTVQTLAGTGIPGAGDGAVVSATLADPTFVAARNSNEIIFMDTRPSNGCRLRSLDRGAGSVTTLAGSNSCALPIGSNFGRVGGMVLANDGNVYIADTNIIRRVEFSPFALTDIAGVFGPAGFVDGPGPGARFATPNGLAVDGTDLYVADTDNNAIRRIDLSVNPVEVSTLAFDVPLNAPTTVAIVGNTIVIAEASSASFYSGTLGGNPIALDILAGRNENAGSADSTTALNARFDEPSDLSMLANAPDTLYVADLGNEVVRTIDLASADLAVETLPQNYSLVSSIRLAANTDRLFVMVAETGRTLIHSLNVSASPVVIDQTAEFPSAFLEGIAEFEGFVYAAEPNNSLIKRMNASTGDVELFAGVLGENNVADGPISVARFRRPYALVGCAGDLYVAESSESASVLESHVIRKIDFSQDPTVVTTIAGFATSAGHVDGFGLQARFDRPESLACDERDPNNPILYVAERGTQTIRQIELSSGRVSTLVGISYQGATIDGLGTEAGFNNPQGLFFDPSRGDLFVVDSNENVVRRIQ